MWRADRGKWDKPPLDPKTGGAGSSTNPAAWASYAIAANRAAKEGFAGVGFALSADDNTTGLDLDKCRNAETGVLDIWAAEIIALAETYAEVSPSGTGVRLFAEGKVAETFISGPGHVEVYATKRYLTVTGQHIEGTPTDIRPAPKTIAALRERVERFKAHADAERGTVQRPREERASSGPTNGSGFFTSVNSLALAHLDQWVPNLLPRAKRTPLGYRVTSRSLHRDHEEDLSITREGIKDFGVHDMGDPRGGKRSPIDLVMEHDGARDAVDAAKRLCEQLGVDPASLGWRSSQSARQEPPPAADAERGKTDQPAAIVWYGDAEPTPPEYLIEGVLPRKQLAILGGQSGAGKTFIGIDASISTMTASPFIGHEVSRPGGVLWLAAEGQNEVAIRLKAAAIHRFGEDRLKQLPFAQQAFEVPTLTEADAFAKLIALVDATKAGLAERFPGTDLVLIVIDTLASAAGFQDENSASETQKVMALLRRLSDTSGALVLVIDHYGKMTETGVRGSSAKIGAADAILAALADKSTEGEISNRRLAVVKLRSAPTGAVTPFRLAPVKVDVWGNTHCGVEWTIPVAGSEKQEAKPEKAAWSGKSRILKSAIERAMIEYGQDVRPWGPNESYRKAVQRDRVRTEFYASYSADSQEAKKKAFSRFTDQATAGGLIASREMSGTDWLWIVKEEANHERPT